MELTTGSAKRPNTALILGLMLLGVIVLIVCVAGGLLIMRSMGSGQAEAPTPPPPELDVPTAREAYPLAVEVARAEDPAAKLASGAGAWTPVITTANLQAGRTGWTFHFYLPSRQEMIWVVVGRGGGARITRRDPWVTPPSLLDDQGWQVDSGAAMTLGLQNCQPVLDGNIEAQAEARLSLAAANRALLWQLAFTVPGDAGAACRVNVDATTGQVR